MIDTAYHSASVRSMDNSNYAQERTNRGQNRRGRPVSGNNPRPDFSNNLLTLLQNLLQQLLAQLNQHSQCPHKPPQPEPKPLDLSATQQDNLKNLLGLSQGAPVGVQILDKDGNGQVSAGDIAIASGGITGGEISRKTLTADDVAAINQTAGVPADFVENKQRWEQTSANANSISYTTQQSCFCPQDFVRPMNITEQNGQITQATYADEAGGAVPDNIVDNLLTVDQRFAQLQNAYEGNAEIVNATYDPVFGYPTSVFIDQSTMIADEETSYTINNLNITALL